MWKPRFMGVFLYRLEVCETYWHIAASLKSRMRGQLGCLNFFGFSANRALYEKAFYFILYNGENVSLSLPSLEHPSCGRACASTYVVPSTVRVRVRCSSLVKPAVHESTSGSAP